MENLWGNNLVALGETVSVSPAGADAELIPREDRWYVGVELLLVGIVIDEFRLLARYDELAVLLAMEMADELGSGLLIWLSESPPAELPPQPVKRTGIRHVMR